MVLPLIATGLSLYGTMRQRSAEKQAAEERKKVGELEARQYVSELFLAKAQAIDATNRRIRDALDAEKQNTAFFSAKIASSDRSVEAYLKRNREIVQKIGGRCRQAAHGFACQSTANQSKNYRSYPGGTQSVLVCNELQDLSVTICLVGKFHAAHCRNDGYGIWGGKGLGRSA